MPKYQYIAEDISLGDDTTGQPLSQQVEGTIIAESEKDAVMTIGLTDLRVKKIRVIDINVNPEGAIPPQQRGQPPQMSPDMEGQPSTGMIGQQVPPPMPPNAYIPMNTTILQPDNTSRNMGADRIYEDNGIKYMIRGGKLFKEDWVPCEKTRFKIIHTTQTGKKKNITEEVDISRLDWKELA